MTTYYYYLSTFRAQPGCLPPLLSCAGSQTVTEAGVISKAMLLTPVWLLDWDNSQQLELPPHLSQCVGSAHGPSSMAAPGKLSN